MQSPNITMGMVFVIDCSKAFCCTFHIESTTKTNARWFGN